MGILKRIENFEIGLGENLGDYSQEIAKGAGRFICGIRSKYPQSFAHNPISKGFLNSVCRMLEIPQSVKNIADFTGGQCEGVIYEGYGYSLQSLQTGLDYGPLERHPDYLYRFFQATNIVGKVTATYMLDPNGAVVDYATYKAKGRRLNDSWQYVVVHNNGKSIWTGQSAGNWGMEVTQWKRADGLTECGNPSSIEPLDPPYNPSDFNNSVTICERDSNKQPVNCRQAPITFDPKQIDNFPVCVQIENIKVCYTPDGFTIDDVLDPPGSNLPQKEPSIDELPKEEQEEGDKEKEQVEKLVGVIVSIKNFGVKTKIVAHKKSSDSDYFAGYISWTAVVNNVKTTVSTFPVRKLRGYFEKPEKAEGYSVYSTYGAVLQVTEVKEKEDV